MIVNMKCCSWDCLRNKVVKISDFMLVMQVVVGYKNIKMEVNSRKGFSWDNEWAVKITCRRLIKVIFKGVVFSNASMEIGGIEAVLAGM